jgi:predicted DNA-binding protein
MVSETTREPTTTVRINPETKKRLDSLGAKNDTYEDIISRLLDWYEVHPPEK